MNRAQRTMIASGLIIVLGGMVFGLYYALFAEHQHLAGMGTSLSTSMAEAASGRLADAQQSLSQYGDVRYNYLRNVHAHSHWSSLGIFLMLLGLALKAVHYDERVCMCLALLLIYGSVAFPMGVWLATLQLGLTAKVFSITGAIALLGGISGYAWGLRPSKQAE